MSDKKSPPLLVVVSVLLTLLVAEVGLRLMPQRTEVLDVFRANPHGELSYRYKPSMDLETRFGDSVIHFQTNSLGMRWREVTYANPSRRTRIAVLGDSFTSGYWATSNDKSFVGWLDRTLDSKQYEVLNFGVGGYGLDDMALILEDEVFRFHPAFVVLVFFSGNDFRDTYLGLETHVIENGVLVWRGEEIRRKLGVESPKTRTFSLRSSRVLSLFWDAVSSRSARADSDFIVSDDFMSYTYWSQRQYPPAAQAAVSKSLAQLETIRERVRAQGAKLFILALPFREQVMAKATEGAQYDIRRPQIYVEEFSRQRKIPYLDLLPHLRHYVSQARENPYAPGDPHFTDKGHEVVGLELAKYLERELALTHLASDK